MKVVLQPILLAVLGLTLAACQTPSSSEAQTLRDRLQNRIAERQGGAQPGVRGASGGETMSVSVGGLTRNFIVFAPETAGSSPGAVLVYHGAGGSAERMAQNNPMVSVGRERGFVVVYPVAVDGTWTDGRMTTAGGPDDVAFTRAMIGALGSQFGVDPSRVFATGISNGGIMTHKLACDAPGLVRAIAPVAGNIPEALAAACNPSVGTPVMMFNGTDDPLMPYNGGRPELERLLRVTGNLGQDQMLSSENTAAFWAARNGCGGPSSDPQPDRVADGTEVTEIDWACGSRDVSLFRIEGGGHTWPGAQMDAPRLVGAVSQEIDAARTMADFFRSYGL